MGRLIGKSRNFQQKIIFFVCVCDFGAIIGGGRLGEGGRFGGQIRYICSALN